MRVGYRASHLDVNIDCAYPQFRCEDRWELTLIRYILVSAGEPIELVRLEEVTFGGYINGSWRGLLAHVRSGHVDTLAETTTLTELRVNNFNFSYPFVQSDPIFLVAHDAEAILEHQRLFFNEETMNFLKIFQPTTWLVMLLVFAALSLTWAAVRHRPCHARRLAETLVSSGWQTFANVFSQNTIDTAHMQSRWLSSRPVVLMMALTAVFTLQLYQGYLLSTMVRPTRLPPPVTDTEGLVRQLRAGQIQLVVQTGGSYEEVIDHSPADVPTRIRATFRNGRRLLTMSTDAILSTAADASTVVLVNREATFDALSREAESLLDSCQLRDVDAYGIVKRLQGMVLSANASTTYKRLLDEVIIANSPRLLALQLQRRQAYETQTRQCRQRLTTLINRVGRPLHLGTMAGAVCLLLAGLACAGCCFAAELARLFPIKSIHITTAPPIQSSHPAPSPSAPDISTTNY